MKDRSRVLVRGAGDVGSAVAVVLYRAGYAVALHDDPTTTTPRRGMAFADAVFDGSATLDGLTGVRVKTPAELCRALDIGDAVPVAVTSFDDAIEATNWSALIDARMRKRAVPEGQRGLAPLTVGLGPNFVAGDTVDFAIETMWGDRLGEIIEAGATLPLAGEPRPIGGVLRGLTRSGVDVPARTKVIEVDPRGDPAKVLGLGERPRRIAEGVLSAIARVCVAEPA